VYYHISHTTTYTYPSLVRLQPHLVRLRPRCNGWQRLHNFFLHLDPTPLGISQVIDLDGNTSHKLWFEGTTETLEITATAQVETCQTNPFDYLLEPWAIELPIDYPSSLFLQLQPYLKSYSPVPDPHVVELAQDIASKVENKTTAFLGKLNQHLNKICKQILRDSSDPWMPGITLKSQRGSSRDLTVLFMDVCRAMGLAARFVSGYQEGDPDAENRRLHTWAEVYLPGAGWRGYDPTQGLAVSDTYVAVAASAVPAYTIPISGDFIPVDTVSIAEQKVSSQMTFHIDFRAENGIAD
jgi:transglutaminase-like putative cysteine protease